MDDDHCVITTQHRICEIPIAADKRQFSVFVNMSVACTLQNDAANIKKMIPSARKREKIFQKTESPSQRRRNVSIKHLDGFEAITTSKFRPDSYMQIIQKY